MTTNANGSIAHLQSHPTKEMTDFLAVIQRDSKASCSTVRKDFICDDGILVVTSHDGQPFAYEIEPLPNAS